MKKIIALLLCIAIICMSLASCANESTTSETEISTKNTSGNTTSTNAEPEKPKNEYIVLQGNVYDSSSGAEHKSEFEVYSKKYESSGKKGSVEYVEAFGEFYPLSYVKTTESYRFNSIQHCYRYIGDSLYIDAYFSNSTGKLELLILSPFNYKEEHKEQPKLTREQCLDLAWEHLKTRVSDIENYRVVEDEYKDETKSAFGGEYEFLIRRIVSGEETNDSMRCRITVYGDIYAYTFKSIGELKDGEEVISNQDDAAISEAINDKMASIYKKVEGKYDITRQILGRGLERVADGKYIYNYTIGVTLKSKTDGSIEYQEPVNLIVYLK